MKVIELNKKATASNDRDAALLREELKSRGLFLIRLHSVIGTIFLIEIVIIKIVIKDVIVIVKNGILCLLFQIIVDRCGRYAKHRTSE